MRMPSRFRSSLPSSAFANAFPLNADVFISAGFSVNIVLYPESAKLKPSSIFSMTVIPASSRELWFM